MKIRYTCTVIRSGNSMEEPQEAIPTVNQAEQKKNFWQDFRSFLMQYSVVGLAIGVVLGTAVNNLVQTLAKGVVTPLVNLLVPSENLQTLVVRFGRAEFLVGEVITAAIHFIAIAFIVFFTVKVLLKNEELLKKK